MDGARCHTKEYRTITRVVIGQALRRLPVVVEIKTTTEAASCNCLKAREHEYCKSGAGGKHRSCLYCRGGKWLARYGWLVACDYRSGRASGPAAGLPPCLHFDSADFARGGEAWWVVGGLGGLLLSTHNRLIFDTFPFVTYQGLITLEEGTS